jgi:hypothetical protein
MKQVAVGVTGRPDGTLRGSSTVARHRVRASSLGKCRDRVDRLVRGLGEERVGLLRPEQIATWQSELLATLSPKTVGDTRTTARAVMAEAVNLGLRADNPVDTGVGAAVALLFVHGWRVSEALGLAWSDLDLETGFCGRPAPRPQPRLARHPWREEWGLAVTGRPMDPPPGSSIAAWRPKSRSSPRLLVGPSRRARRRTAQPPRHAARRSPSAPMSMREMPHVQARGRESSALRVSCGWP